MEALKVVTETIKEMMFEGKMITITVRANRPSPEAIKGCAKDNIKDSASV